MLLAQTPLQQVLRLPILIEHYYEHRSQNGGFSLSAFLVLHYFSGNPKYADYERDMQLPFRANDVVLISSTVVPPAQLEVDFTPPVYKEKTYPLLGADDLPPRHAVAIFQPPKSC